MEERVLTSRRYSWTGGLRIGQAPRQPTLATLLLLAMIAPAHAQSAAPGVLAPMVVTGSVNTRTLADAPAALGVVDAYDLRSSGPMVNLSEALGRVPGIVVANRSNYAQDLQISSRGFGARAGFGVRGLRLYTDGIPATMPDGQGQVTHFDLAGASRIEVLRGPFSVLYGNASGGVLALFSEAPTERRAGIDVDGGSFGLRQARLTVEAPFGQGWDVRASYSDFSIDGFRPHSEAQRKLGNLRLGWHDDANRVLLLASDITQAAQDPLGLTRAQLDADPDQTTSEATTFDTRKTARQSQLGARWEHRFDGAGPLRTAALTGYYGSRGVTQWQAIAPATQASPRHGGGVVDFDRSYGGTDARLGWKWNNVSLVTGATLERQRDDRRGFENFIGSGSARVLGVTGALRRDEANRISTRDIYAQAEMAVTDTLSATLGLRGGRVDFTAADRFLANGDDSGALRFHYRNPLAGLRWEVQPGLTLHASAARGFESPTLNELAYRPDGQAGFNNALQPQTSRQFELGARWTAGELQADATVFHIDTAREIGVQTNSGGRSTFQNVGRTRRDGAEAALQWRVSPRLRWQAALSWLDARYRDRFLTCAGVPCTTPNLAVPAGNRIAGTFARSAFTALEWQPLASQPTRFAVEWRGQGRTAVNDVNSDFAAGFGVVGLRATHYWSFAGGQRLELLARIDNVGNRRHVGSVIVNDANGRSFEPAPSRNGLISLRWSTPW
jgi:iron complex outermembrane recepter protein